MKYRFGRFEIDLDSHQLLVDGRPRPIEPQVFDVLRHLVENAGRLVDRESLIDAAWDGRNISDSAISARISAARSAVGDDGKTQAIIQTVPRRGFRFAASVETVTAEGQRPGAPNRSPASQRIRLCTSRDGTRIAFATTGEGQPLVRAGHWLTHLEKDWQSPVWRPLLDELGRHFCITRYDQRGNGLSDWKVGDFSLDRFVDDLEAVVDAAGLERFALYGTSQGAAIAVAYAVRHPDRVSHLILHGGYMKGRRLRGTMEERESGKALLTLIRHGWGKPGSAFLKSFSSMYIPGGRAEQIDSLAELQRQTTNSENAVALREAVDGFDVSDLVGRIVTPTLVLHARNDGVHPIEQGRALAAGIADAEFVTLDSDNHVILQHEPAWTVLFEELRRFVGA